MEEKNFSLGDKLDNLEIKWMEQKWKWNVDGIAAAVDAGKAKWKINKYGKNKNKK